MWILRILMIMALSAPMTLWAADDHHEHDEHDDHAEKHADHDDHAEAEDDVSDHVTRMEGIEILHAWAQATDSTTVQVFMEISNESAQDVTILGGDTDIGGAVAVMAMDYSDGARAVGIGSFPLKSGAEIDLTPDGLFLEIADLAMHLDEGASFEMHIEFDPIGEIEVIVEVEAEDASTHSHAGHNH